MTSNTRLWCAVGVVLLAAGATVPSTQAETPDEIIAARQAGYKHIGDINDAMKKAVADGTDITGFAGPAKEIADWGRKVTALFPPGTEKGHDTKARPEIWTNKADFDADAAALVTEAEKLATVAGGGDKAAFAAQWKVMGGTCGACHREYRYRS